MKIVRVPAAYRIEAFDGPTERITPVLVEEVMKPVYENKLKITSCAYEIEALLEQIVATYFFANRASDDRRTDFIGQILASSWCSFDSKRKLVLFIVERKKLLTGKAKDDYERQLRKVISYRNAFTHGSMSTDGRQVKLSYFEGGPRSEFLSDEWLSRIEAELNACFDTSFSLVDLVRKSDEEPNKAPEPTTTAVTPRAP